MAARPRASARSTRSDGSRSTARVERSVGDDFSDLGHPILDDALDTGLERHRGHGTRPTRTDQRDVDDAVLVDAVKHDVAAVRLQRRADRVERLAPAALARVGGHEQLTPRGVYPRQYPMSSREAIENGGAAMGRAAMRC